jgi:hypothetical protein
MTRRQILVTLAFHLEIHSGPFGKRLKNRLEEALPSYTIHLDTDKSSAGSTFRKHAIAVWGNGIEYANSVYLCTYNVPNWRDSLIGDAKNYIRSIDETSANDARIASIDGKLATLEEDAAEIQAQLKRLLASHGIERVPAAVRKKYPALFGGAE